jgi:hypothetical protein
MKIGFHPHMVHDEKEKKTLVREDAEGSGRGVPNPY